jgi:hypothetical protein
MKSGFGYKLEVDTTGAEGWAELPITSVGEAFNEVISTYFKLKDEGFATNEVTAIDPQFDLGMRGEEGDTALDHMLGLRFSPNRKAPMKITDNLTGEAITFAGVFTAISSTRNENVVEITATVKMQGKPTIV